MKSASTALKIGSILGWVSLATVAILVLIALLKPTAPAWAPDVALLLPIGIAAGLVGALLCWLSLDSGPHTVARNGIIRGGSGTLLNAVLMSMVTITTVVQTPV